MSHRPLIVPAFAPSRSVLVASFAACGVLLLGLFVILMGCTPFTSSPDFQSKKAEPHDLNAILCECSCDGFFDPVPPSEVTIGRSEDDGTQVSPQAGMTLNRPLLALGENNNVGLRFRLGVPQGSQITSASIQFSAEQNDEGDFDFTIHVVDSRDAPQFETTTDLRDGNGVNLANISVPWKGSNRDTDWVMNERLDNEQTPNLKDLVQKIVSRGDFTPNNAIAFVIRGAGRRHAVSFEGAGTGALKISKPPTLTVVYTPNRIVQDILTCGDVNDKQNVCGQRLQTAVNGLANMCKLSHTCTCNVKPGSDQDATRFSAVCNAHNAPGGCEAVAPDSCEPGHIAKATVAKLGDQPVCVASSPLGSVLFGQSTACEIQGTANCEGIRSTDGDNSCVSARVFDSDDSVTSYSTPRGRIEFIETPCSAGSRCYGMRHQVRIGDLTFESGSLIGDLFEGDHKVVDLSGVGASAFNVGVPTSGPNQGQGQFVGAKHSVRGTEEGGATAAAFAAGEPLDFGLGGWQSNGVCTLRGFVLKTGNFEMFANIKGKLVNQPPTVVLAPQQPPVECNDIGLAAFALDAIAHDPDNNVASFGWYRDSRTGPLVGTMPSVELEQPLGETSYVFKVVDTFGQYAEAITKVSVVDTTAPTVTAPPAVEVECTGDGQAVTLGNATATDVCDASPAITNDAPPLFFVGPATTVTWTATDKSRNSGTATQTVKVVDTKPPVLTVTLSPTVLWPPNHKLVPITATITVKDKCDPHPTVKLVSITSNEPDNGLGDGDTTGDIQGAALQTDDREFLLRSERSGPGGGRVYTVIYEARDASGNTTRKEATVTVPKNQSAKP